MKSNKNSPESETTPQNGKDSLSYFQQQELRFELQKFKKDKAYLKYRKGYDPLSENGPNFSEYWQ